MVVDINIRKLKNFEKYPFKLSMDENMKELLKSIVINGIINPLIVREKEDYYEIISGHRRKYIAEILNIKEIPCIIKDMNDEEAIIVMVDSNIQRENILPSEKSLVYKMKLEAIKIQGKKIIVLDTTSESWRLKGIESIIETDEEGTEKIGKYIKLSNLIPELLELVDIKRIALRPAIELSYLNENNQHIIKNIFEYDDVTPNLSQAIRMKKLEQKGNLTKDMIELIMQEEKPNQKEKFSITYEKLRKILPNDYSNKQINNIIYKLLENYSKKNKK